MSNFTVGLTGGIGSGKSAISDRFAELGTTIVDADLASRVVVESGRPALALIAGHFGGDLLKEDGTLNRALLRQKIFAQQQERIWLEQLLHPLIDEEIEKGLRESQSLYAMLVSPLLIEARQIRFTHRVLVVDVPLEVQIRRTMARDNNSEEQVRAIISSQTSREARLAHADDVIVNDRDFAALDGEIVLLHQMYLRLAGSHR